MVITQTQSASGPNTFRFILISWSPNYEQNIRLKAIEQLVMFPRQLVRIHKWYFIRWSMPTIYVVQQAENDFQGNHVKKSNWTLLSRFYQVNTILLTLLFRRNFLYRIFISCAISSFLSKTSFATVFERLSSSVSSGCRCW